MIYLVDYLVNHTSYIDEVAQLKYNQWLHTSPDRPYEVWLSEIKDSACSDRPPLTLIALYDNGNGTRDLAGFVTLIDIEENASIKDSLWLITLFVKAPYRRQGIGSHLLQRCLAESRRLKAPALYLWTENKTLTAFYAKRGWKLMGTDEETGEDIMVYTHVEKKKTSVASLIKPAIRDDIYEDDDDFDNDDVDAFDEVEEDDPFEDFDEDE